MRRSLVIFGIAALATLTLTGGCSTQATSPPYKPAATVVELMEGTLAHAAEVYWDSVSTMVDDAGTHEHFPKTDEEWEAVWTSGMTIAETGNLLMMPSRAKDDGDWMKFSAALVDVGIEATKAAESKDRERVLDVGGQVYLACVNCHMQYIVEAP